MKRIALIAVTAAVIGLPLHAQTVSPALRAYIKKALPDCPGGKVLIEKVPGAPKNFERYKVQLMSPDTSCGTVTSALHSPTTNQVILSQAFELPVAPGSPLASRVDLLAEKLLKIPVNIVVAPGALPDGIKQVDIQKFTQYGTFTYRGYVDATEKYLMVGPRGNLMGDPGMQILGTFRTADAPTRGKVGAKTTIIELSDFQCPTCRNAHKLLEPLIKKNLGKISYTRIDLPLFESHEWAFQAAMGARAVQKVAPQKYWEYVDYMFENQDKIQRTNVETFIKNFLEDNDIKWSAIEPHYKSRTDMGALINQVSKAFDFGAYSTPTFIVNGQIISYGVEGSHIKSVLEKTLAAAK